MRRGIYVLLTVFLVQLSGLRGLCVPSGRQAHACCPMDGHALPAGSSLPDCCIGALLTCQGSITEARNVVRPSQYTAQSASVPAAPHVCPTVVNRPVGQFVLPSASPPLSPLAQSCLLLI